MQGPLFHAILNKNIKNNKANGKEKEKIFYKTKQQNTKLF